MTKYLKNNIYGLLLIIAVVCSSIQCTKVNHQLGNSIISSDKLLEIKFDTLTGFEVHTISVDSIRVDRFLHGHLGSYVSPRIGRVDMAVTSELTTSLTTLGHDVNLDDYILDSVTLNLALLGLVGDFNTKMKVTMYELKENFRKPYNNVYRDSAPEGYFDPYYSNFDYTKYINDTPLTTFEIDVHEVLQGDKTFEVELPKEIGERAMLVSRKDYDEDSRFRKIFKGVTFVAESVYSNGSIVKITPEASYIEFHVYNKKVYEEKEEKEYISFAFNMSHWKGTELYGQVVTTIDVDHSFISEGVSIPQSLINDTLNTQTESYISGFGETITRLTFPMAELEEIKEQLADTPSAAILVTNATMIIPIKNVSIGGLNSSLESLGAFYNYSIPIYMPDYQANEYGQLTDVYFDGILNRSHNYYIMNVTSYIQKLLNNKTEYNRLEITPSDKTEGYPSSLFTDKIVGIDNTASNPISLRLVYSVLK